MTVLLFKTGNPPPALIWTKHGQVIDRSYRSEWIPLSTAANSTEPPSHANTDDEFGLFELSTVNDLLLPALQRPDLFSVYTCQATNNNLTAPLSKSVSIELLCKYSLFVFFVNNLLFFCFLSPVVSYAFEIRTTNSLVVYNRICKLLFI
jgi:hypothetical protein